MLLFQDIRSDNMIKYEMLRMPPLMNEEGFIADENILIYRYGISKKTKVPLVFNDVNINTISAACYNYSNIKEIKIPEGIEVIE